MNPSAPQPTRPDRKKEMLLGLVLLLALLAVWLSWRSNQSPATAVVERNHAMYTADLAANVDDVVTSLQRRLDAYAEPIAAEWPAPPTAPAARAAAPVSQELTFRLRGVARHGEEAVAFVDDRTVALGEAMDGFTLIRITDESATFRDARGREHVLSVYEGSP